jgi:hypothetical protein
MQNSFTKVQIEKEYSQDFCICTIVTNIAEYEIMKHSFEATGFTNSCNYLIADNTNNNVFDAYQAIRRFLQESNAKYTIVVHQDVRCKDAKIDLEHCLAELTKKDNAWAICGNAGGIDYKNMVYHIHNIEVRKTKGLPIKVFSLDENFLVFNTAKQLSISANINGFHFYGTDLCIIADLLGYSSYVIPFMVEHLSKGNLKDLELHKTNFILKYGYKLRSRFMQTSCDKFFLGNSVSQNKLYNISFIFFWIKAYRRIANKFKY